MTGLVGEIFTNRNIYVIITSYRLYSEYLVCKQYALKTKHYLHDYMNVMNCHHF